MFSILDTLLCIKNICHHLSNSLFQAINIVLSLNCPTIVSIDCLPKGGVFKIDISFILLRAIFKLLGIGVADIDNTSIVAFSFLTFSLSSTQNLCSSSKTSSHKFLKTIFSLSSLCVHTTKSNSQDFSKLSIRFVFLSLSNLVKTHIFNQNNLNLSNAFS